MVTVMIVCFGLICAWLVLEEVFVDLRTRPHLQLAPRSPMIVVVPEVPAQPVIEVVEGTRLDIPRELAESAQAMPAGVPESRSPAEGVSLGA